MPCCIKGESGGAVHSSKSEYNMQTHPNQRNVVPRIKRGIFAHTHYNNKKFYSGAPLNEFAICAAKAENECLKKKLKSHDKTSQLFFLSVC